MGWFTGQLLALLLLAFLVGLLAGYLWWVWGWKKYRDEQVSTSIDHQTARATAQAGQGPDRASTGRSGGGSAGAIRALASTPGTATNATSAGTETGDVIDLTDGGMTRDEPAAAGRAMGAGAAAAASAAVERQLATARGDLDSARPELDTAKAALSGTSAELEKLKADLAAANQDVRTTKESLASVSSELRTVTTDLEACRTARQGLQQDLDQARAELGRAREATRSAQQEREAVIDLRDENEMLREQLRVAQATTPAPTAVQGFAGGARVLGDYGEDDLERIEGIGPKIGDALRAAGIRSFPRLVATDDDELRAALEAAKLRFAPSLPTWRMQAAYLVRGDEAGFVAYTEQLVAGRDPGTTQGPR